MWQRYKTMTYARYNKLITTQQYLKHYDTSNNCQCRKHDIINRGHDSCVECIKRLQNESSVIK